MEKLKYLPTPHSYSQAVAAGDYVFLAMHRGFGPDFTAQFHEAFKSLNKTLGEFGLELKDLVSVEVRMKDIRDVRVYEKLFREYFEPDRYPARMGGTTLFIDEDCLFMIGGIAYRGGR